MAIHDSGEAALRHKRATFWLFEQLMRDGIVPYTPASPGDGVDAAIRCDDGTYRDLVVCPSHDEHFPLAFRARGLEPRPRLFVVCVAWALEPVQVWVFPSSDFDRFGVLSDNVTVLDLESTATEGGASLKQNLSRYRNAWRLLLDGAVRVFVP